MTGDVININGEPGGEPAVRTLPHNLEAEMAFLGAVFIDDGKTILEAVSGLLKPEHFAYASHGRVYEAAVELNVQGKPANPVTLKRFFELDDNLAEIGGPAYLAELTASAVTPINAREYARMIYDLWLRRQMITASENFTEALHDPDPGKNTVAIRGDLDNQLAALDGGAPTQGSLAAVSGMVGGTLDEIRDASAGDGMVGMTTGIMDLDRKLGGLMDSDLIVVAARPAMGKTSLATTMARANARSGKRVAFFSLEMSEGQVTMRLLAMETGIAASDMRAGQVSETQMPDLERAGETIKTLSLHIDGRGGIEVSDVRQCCRRMKRKHGLDLVVVDYLQLLVPQDRYRGNKVNEVSEITAALKTLAKELDVPVVLLSQLNRALEQRDDKRPRLSDLRDSGSIEQDADVVLFVYREAYYIDMEGEPVQAADQDADDFTDTHAAWIAKREAAHGKAEIIIAKQRMGPTGLIRAHFNETRTLFGDLDERELDL